VSIGFDALVQYFNLTYFFPIAETNNNKKRKTIGRKPKNG